MSPGSFGRLLLQVPPLFQSASPQTAVSFMRRAPWHPPEPRPRPPCPPQIKDYNESDLYRGTAWSVREKLIDAFEHTQDYWQ